MQLAVYDIDTARNIASRFDANNLLEIVVTMMGEKLLRLRWYTTTKFQISCFYKN